ncbi:hypothetical protein Z517_04249 [Fonsecaea pedrosoi CBS 271.37]|uniref:Uncharacterized protein n=1 Tax=Fonsecaea pedrosoi CBS 271.37 TaxID=1442368 RepID=A0A0D2H9G1_9EURO|nr:uncharacterized protein Z517_04249 [Fonsecaea pedrosoi CBS 271.37]KIW81224.1 hypothetical protein Z517_04249 [Fonsecaea pedrosoi CBS 271.37]
MLDGGGLLASASAAGDLEKVKSLLNQASDRDKHEALRFAIKANALVTVNYLLHNNVKPSVFDFEEAVKQCSYPILELLLSSGFNINEPIREDSPPPLASALFNSSLVHWLIEHGANPNAQCRFDITPLSIAAQSASKEVIEQLFELGASVKYGQPLHFAVYANRPDEIITLLLEKGAPINGIMFEDHQLSYYHWKEFGLGTPLHIAAEAGNARLVKLLQERGANLNIRDTLGQLPRNYNVPG